MEERDETAVEEEHQTNDDGDGSVNDVPSTYLSTWKKVLQDRHETARTFQLGSNKSKAVKECGVCLQSFLYY